MAASVARLVAREATNAFPPAALHVAENRKVSVSTPPLTTSQNGTSEPCAGSPHGCLSGVPGLAGEGPVGESVTRPTLHRVVWPSLLSGALLASPRSGSFCRGVACSRTRRRSGPDLGVLQRGQLSQAFRRTRRPQPPEAVTALDSEIHHRDVARAGAHRRRTGGGRRGRGLRRQAEVYDRDRRHHGPRGRTARSGGRHGSGTAGQCGEGHERRRGNARERTPAGEAAADVELPSVHLPSVRPLGRHVHGPVESVSRSSGPPVPAWSGQAGSRPSGRAGRRAGPRRHTHRARRLSGGRWPVFAARGTARSARGRSRRDRHTRSVSALPRHRRHRPIPGRGSPHRARGESSIHISR